VTDNWSSESQAPPELETNLPQSARVWNYWLGGKDNFPADRQVGDQVREAFPGIVEVARAGRGFLARAVGYLTGEAGVRQFLDVGTGIPTANNTHEVAQRTAPDSRIVYVDNDPIVLAHARALLTSTPQGATAYVDADLRDPTKILDDPELRNTLDFSQPVALMLVAVLHFILDEDDPYGIVARLVEALPPGSFLVVAQATYDPLPPHTVAALEAANARGNPKSRPRSRAEFARFFVGLDILPPGIVSVAEWRAEGESQPRPSFADISGYAAVGRIT
jgi:trans-aconitate methyltransferase